MMKEVYNMLPDEMGKQRKLQLKLAIKSSFSDAKKSIGFMFLLWMANGKKAMYQYSEEIQQANGKTKIVVRDAYAKSIYERIKVYLQQGLGYKDVKNQIDSCGIFTAQIEPIFVAFSLIWRIARVRFRDSNRNYSAERTSGNRFDKVIDFTKNMDIIANTFYDDEEKFVEILASWLLSLPINDTLLDSEVVLIKQLTNVSERAIYQVKGKNGPVIFTQSGIYEPLVHGKASTIDVAEVSGDVKGPARILKSSIAEGLNAYLKKTTAGIVLNSGNNKNELAEYAQRVDTYTELTPIYADDLDTASEEPTNLSFDEDDFHDGAINMIVYGAPGTGKSHYVSDNFPDFSRVTFHPEYSYYDFVGTLRPVQDNSKQIAYKFVPGIFTLELVKAFRDPSVSHGLIIEELNRANTAAVFGDLFQLLDRKNNGWSKYPIANKDVLSYLSEQLKFELTSFKLPSNFSIVATMNSADQGVQPLDSAFKRRWQFKYMPINFNDDGIKNEVIAGFDISWKTFGTILNKFMVSRGIQEDKLIGQWFMNAKEMSNPDLVSSKLLLYLWDDIFRYRREQIFSQTSSFSQVIADFHKSPFSIFTQELRLELQKGNI